MKRKFYVALVVFVILLFGSDGAFAQGKARLAVPHLSLGAGQELGAVVILSGTGNYDLYAAVTGGVLGDELYLFRGTLDLVPLSSSVSDTASLGIPKLMENLNFESLSVADRIVTLIPKLTITDGSLAGIYTFFVALTSPGRDDFQHDTLTVEIKWEGI
ncbi:MAG: hypothetical protein HQK66_00945 [Desulfamplus sp.]|nr:hypothetical protein [Desulfamplus sp.]